MTAIPHTEFNTAGIERPERPYPGLRSFRPDEWPIFFGRERMAQEVIDRLVERRVVAVHGSSGSGKSSLIAAGVLPRLGNSQARAGGLWRTCVARPSDRPLWNLAEALARLDPQHRQEREFELRRLLNRGSDAPAAIADAMRCTPRNSICILLDQFEELFEYADRCGDAQAELITEFLVALEQEKPAGLYVILTMRSDYIGRCAQYDGFAELVNATQYLVPRMQHRALVRAIREPATLYGGSVDAELAQRLIENAGSGQDQLPLLQHGLMLLWDQKRKTAKELVLGLEDYQAAGDLASQLSAHADRLVAEAVDRDSHRPKVTASDKDARDAGWVIEHVFRALAHRNAEGQAIRRPQRFDTLLALTETSENRLNDILLPFRTEDASFLRPYEWERDRLGADDVVDISHEALIRNWNSLSGRGGWLDLEQRDGLIWRSLRLDAERFATNVEKLLQPVVADDHNRWLKGRNAAWAERHGGGFEQVKGLINASRYRDATVWDRRGRRPADVDAPYSELQALDDYENALDADTPHYVRAYLKACKIALCRERLILSVKGGHVSDAYAAMRKLRELGHAELLYEEDCGTEPNRLRKGFWVAITGRDDPKVSDGPRANKESVFDGKDGEQELKRTVGRNMTPLAWAACAGHRELVEKMIGKGADPNLRILEGDNIIAAAAVGGNVDVVKYLVEDVEDSKKLDPLAMSEHGSPPIIWAIQERHGALVEYLQKKGQRLDFETDFGWNALTEAARGDYLDFARRLVAEHGFDPLHTAQDKQTALHAACSAHRVPTARVAAWLCELPEVDILARTTTGATPLHAAAWDGKVAALSVLVDAAQRRGLKEKLLNAQDEDGWTPLHSAAYEGRAEFVEGLLDNGADIDVLDKDGYSPLTRAVEPRTVARGNRRSVQVLLDRGANTNAFRNWSALHFAAHRGDLDMVDRLLKAKSRPDRNAREPEVNWTPVLLACRNGHIEVVRRLLEEIQDASTLQGAAGGIDAFQIAAKHQDVVDQLKKWSEGRPDMKKALERQKTRENNSLTRRLDYWPGRRLEAIRARAEKAQKTDLVDAAERGQLERVKELLQSESDRSSLIEAAKAAASQSHLNVLKALLADERTSLAPLDLNTIALEAAERSDDEVIEYLVAHGAQPRLWRVPQVSSLGGFLRFEEVREDESAELLRWLHDTHLYGDKPFLVGPRDAKRRLRRADLSFFKGCRLLAIERSAVPGQNEQFAILEPTGAILPLDWTNEPIYAAAGKHLVLSSDEDMLTYTRFFFHFVRGVLGRFCLVDHASSFVSWEKSAPEETKRDFVGRLLPLRVILDSAESVKMEATVVLRNALFRTDIVVQKPLGLMELTNEELIVEDLPIEIDSPPGSFG